MPHTISDTPITINTNGNGTANKVVWFLLSSLLTLVLVAGGFMITNAYAKSADLEHRVVSLEITRAELVQQVGEMNKKLDILVSRREQ